MVDAKIGSQVVKTVNEGLFIFFIILPKVDVDTSTD